MKTLFILLTISTLAAMPSGLLAGTDSLRFDTAVFLNGSSQTTSMVTADFNGDGHLELMSGSSINGHFYYFLDTSIGHFGSAHPATCDGGNVYCLAQADFDTNGTIDLAVACFDEVYIYLNDGAGGFNMQEGDSLRGAAPHQMIAADLNKDGLPDLVTADYNSQKVSVLLNLGAGGFDTAATYDVGINPEGVCAADFDHDGNLDLAVSCTNSRAVYLLRGKGDGTLHAATSFGISQHYATQIAAGDFNHDGFADLAVANLIVGHPSPLDIFLNDGAGSFALHETDTVDLQARDIQVADFDKDSNPDLAISCLDNGIVCLLKGKADGSFGKPAHYPVGGGVVRLCAGDFNKDGFTDLAATSWFGDASILINQESSPAGVNDQNRRGGVPSAFSLGQNYPNPFNPTTKITFELPRRSDVTITVYNVLGAKVKTIRAGILSAGHHEIAWDAKDEQGRTSPSGIYFYNLVAGEYRDTKKMVLLK